MAWLLLIALIMVALALIALKGKTKVDEIWPFYPKKPLTTPEQILYFRLVKALPEHIELAQVQLSCFSSSK